MWIDRHFLRVVKTCMLPYPSLHRPSRKKEDVHSIRVERLDELPIITVDVGVWTIV